MPVYSHYNEAKKAHKDLPMVSNVGACLTCTWWDAETPRTESEIVQVGLCIQPLLKPFALIVSGSSACNHWQKKQEAGASAEAYAKLGE